MAFKDKQLINLLNYNSSSVVVSTRNDSYLIEGSKDGTPTVISFSPQEIEVINSKGDAIKIGLLRFEKEEEKENYEALNIFDWQNILTNEEIEKIITEPTFEGLSKLINIKSSSMFERVRGILINLLNKEDNDISNRVEKIIKDRYIELTKGKINTSIILTKKDKLSVQNPLQEENSMLKSELSEMKKMIEQLQKNQLNSNLDDEVKKTKEKNKSKSN